MRALPLFWRGGDFDLFVFVVTETDRLFHFLYPSLEDQSHPWHGRCLDFMARVDECAGRVLELYEGLEGPKRFMAVADHGFTASRTEVDLNAWLAGRGLLSKVAPPRDEWDARVIGHESKAFALDPGRVYIHRASRFARGQVDEAGAEVLAREIRDELAGLTFAGERVMEDVFFGRELYDGPLKDRAPDLVCLARPGFDLKAKFDRAEVFGSFGRHGCHTARGAIFHDSEGARPARLRDVGREILDWLEA